LKAAAAAQGKQRLHNEDEEDDYENDPWDEDSAKKKRAAKKSKDQQPLDMKPAKNNMPANVNDDYEDAFDDAPIVLNNN
jgi:hypothetical protein